MNFAPTRRIVGPDWEQRDFDVVALADFLKSRKVSAVAAVKNRAAIYMNHKAAKSAMKIGEKPRAPVMTGCERNLQAVEGHALPVVQLVHDMESKVVNERADADRDDNGLIRSDSPQGSPVQMIEMGVCYQHQIDFRQMMQFDSRLLQPLDHLQPFRPIRVDQNISIVSLNEKRGMPNPGDAKLTRPDFGKTRYSVFAGTFSKKRRNEDLGQKIPAVPVRRRPERHARRFFRHRAIRAGLSHHPRFF